MTQIIPMVYIIIMLFSNPTQNKKEIQLFKNNNKKINLIKISAPPLQVYHAINKYAKKNSIPYRIIYNVLRLETGWNGPINYSYNYKQTSFTGAEGAMQFIPSTIRWLANDSTLTRKQIRNDVELNIKYGIYYISLLNKKYNNFYVSLGYYNTGYPKINKYSKYAVENVIF